VVAGIVVVVLGGLADHGVAVIGRVEGAVPTPALPDVGWDELLALLPGALAIAVIGYAETATVGESLADEHGDSVRPDRELPPPASPTSWPACSRASSPAVGPASRPPTTAPAPTPSWCRCWWPG
jgi:hypothetical protein